MTKVMWLGEDSEGYAGPSHVIWNGIKFPKDVAVEVTDPYMLGKVRNLGENRFFRLIEETKQEVSHGESQTQSEVKDEKEESTETKDQRKTENRSGYSPIKKRVRKKKPAVTAEPAEPAV